MVVNPRVSLLSRLDEQPGSRWRPQLSSPQFQKLLQNLTAIKIRATFGENGELLHLTAPQRPRFCEKCFQLLFWTLNELRGVLKYRRVLSRTLVDSLSSNMTAVCSWCPLSRTGLPGQRDAGVGAAWRRSPGPLGLDLQLSSGTRGRVLRALLGRVQAEGPDGRRLQSLRALQLQGGQL